MQLGGYASEVLHKMCHLQNRRFLCFLILSNLGVITNSLIHGFTLSVCEPLGESNLKTKIIQTKRFCDRFMIGLLFHAFFFRTLSTPE